MEVILAFDLGTGSVRGCLVSLEGRVVARGSSGIRAHPPETAPAGREYDPKGLRGAIVEATAQALAAAPAGMKVAAVTVASMRPACALLDSSGEPLCLGANRDARAVGEAIELLRGNREMLFRVTGQLPPVLAWSARVPWFRANLPEVWARTALITGIEGWVLSLFGVEAAIDSSSASGTGLYDITAGGWSHEILSAIGLESSRLPQVVPTGTVLGRASGDFAGALGLEGAVVCAGAADTHAALAGSGAWDAGETAVVGGTSMPVARVVADPGPRSARLWSSRHLREGFGVVESNCGESGFAWEWLAEVLGVDVGALDALASEAAPASAVAHLGTAPQDFADMPLLRNGGVMVPLPPGMFGVGRASLARAGIEAAAFGAVEAMAWIDGETTGAGPIRVCGGMTRSRLWLKSLAAAFGRPVLVTQEDATSVGVAACAAAGAGLVADAREVVKATGAASSVVPVDDELAGVLQAGYQRWRDAVVRLEQGAMRISALVG